MNRRQIDITPQYAAAFVVETFRLARDQEWQALMQLRKCGANTDDAWARYTAASLCVDALQDYATLVGR